MGAYLKLYVTLMFSAVRLVLEPVVGKKEPITSGHRADVTSIYLPPGIHRYQESAGYQSIEVLTGESTVK